jgi:CRISPR-associated exonuclease Cas4
VGIAPLLAVAVLLVGVVVLAAGATLLAHRRRDRRFGPLVTIDAGRPETLRSERYHISGRPDILRRAPDGTLVPIELKHRAAPARGGFPSHVVQVWAYCLLVEDTTGRPPAFGVLRYTDREIRVPWNATARAELLAIDRAVRARYDGRATPSPGRCARCSWADVCDVRAGPG